MMNTVKKRFASSSTSSSPKPDQRRSTSSFDNIDTPTLSPELTPIVTLLSAQTHRRYHEGIFMLFYDLNSDGKPADRKWNEVYGILTGTQLAYWDATKLSEFRNNPEALLNASSKPQYINFTDSIFNSMVKLPSGSGELENVVVVSTTLKNRYILQFKTARELARWTLALRLSTFEYTSLQEAYTGALLSARGSRLSDIRVILAEKRYDHEDWVSIRYGSGMAWKRCYAVVEPSTTKRNKFIPGKISFYDNEKKSKKGLMAVVTLATAVYAIFPQAHQLIDHSTMLKVEASISFSGSTKKKDDDVRETSIFLMPEQHSSVPGFDTLIRFLVPLLDSFGLYGRPKRLNADRNDPKSLLFGLPTLPFVHYLEVDDLLGLTTSPIFLNWLVKDWYYQIKLVLSKKLSEGYEGCGSNRGISGALNSLSLSNPNSPIVTNGSTFSGQRGVNNSRSPSSTNSGPPPPPTININDLPTLPKENKLNSPLKPNAERNVNNLTIDANPVKHESMQLANIYNEYSEISAPSDRFNSKRELATPPNQGSSTSLPYPKDEYGSVDNAISVGQPLPYPEDGSESEDDELDFERDEESKRFSTNNGLPVPMGLQNDNGSASSIRSPMTQYMEFNSQFKNSVRPHEVSNDSLNQPFNYSNKSKLYGPQSLSGSANNSTDQLYDGSKISLPKSPPSHNLVQHKHVNSVSISDITEDRSLHSERGNIVSAISAESYISADSEVPLNGSTPYPVSPGKSSTRSYESFDNTTPAVVRPLGSSKPLVVPVPQQPPTSPGRKPPAGYVQAHPEPNGYAYQGQPPAAKPFAPQQQYSQPNPYMQKPIQQQPLNPQSQPPARQQYQAPPQQQPVQQRPPPNQQPGFQQQRPPQQYPAEQQRPSQPIQQQRAPPPPPQQQYSHGQQNPATRQQYQQAAPQGYPQQKQAPPQGYPQQKQAPPPQGYPQQKQAPPPQGYPQQKQAPPPQGYPGQPRQQGPPAPLQQQPAANGFPQQQQQQRPAMQSQPQGSFRAYQNEAQPNYQYQYQADQQFQPKVMPKPGMNRPPKPTGYPGQNPYSTSNPYA